MQSLRWPIASPQNARTAVQRAQLERSLETGQCIFCPGGDSYKESEFLDEQPFPSHSVIWNSWPHAGALEKEGHKCHWVVFPKRCLSDKEDLTLKEWEDILRIARLLMQRYDLDQLFMYTRSGNPAEVCTTITHWHIQFIALTPGVPLEVCFGPFQDVDDTSIRERAAKVPPLEWFQGGQPVPDWQLRWPERKLHNCRWQYGIQCNFSLYPSTAYTPPMTMKRWRNLLKVQRHLCRRFSLTGSVLVGSTADWVFEMLSLELGRCVKFRFER